ncbi:hypothetical protein [Photobacterium alginatilyticum]|uniref:Uncharacterized protein n=1 Tax=Photobacterium alginatilyticum TaxID=1775171 RepID=A0ABW9YSN1_9GAMM|nr:hypothetical protein [Photobacterium alginatilyticum]NBI56305.1 hypothetical protein [Photobacterium alginatilyticum]
MTRVNPQYPQLKQLPDLTNIKDLENYAIKLGEIQDSVNQNIKYVFVNNINHLSILEHRTKKLDDGSISFRSYQTDFPLQFLAWFIEALIDFRKAPENGGLHSGAMVTNDQCIDGEMLCIKRAMAYDGPGIPGYSIVNRSRRNRNLSSEIIYFPQEISFSEQFIFNGGLIKLIQDLADKYQCGKI